MISRNWSLAALLLAAGCKTPEVYTVGMTGTYNWHGTRMCGYPDSLYAVPDSDVFSIKAINGKDIIVGGEKLTFSDIDKSVQRTIFDVKEPRPQSVTPVVIYYYGRGIITYQSIGPGRSYTRYLETP